LPDMPLAREIFCKTALTKTGIPGFQYCLNPYVGCTHRCVYCYASFMGRFTGHSEPWGTYVDAKVNIAEVLAKQLKARRVPEGKVIISSVTDAYQPAEAHYGLTRSCLEALARCPSLEVEILTKSALVVRDLFILREMPRCSVGFTLTTVNEKIARVIEPGAPPPGLRLAAARQLAEAGIAVWVFIAPVLPGIGDSEEALSDLFKELRKAGVQEILADTLNPYPAVLQRLKKVYRVHFPAALADLDLCAAEPGLYRESVKKSLSLLGAGLI
jgi:DNA repair photolyase